MDKLSKSGYIVGDSIEADHIGNISLCGNEITFSNIEFDSEIILNWNSFKCSKEIYNLLAKNDDDTTCPYRIEEIKSFEFSNCIFTYDVYFNLSNNCTLRVNDCIFEKNFNINKHPHPQQVTNEIIEINQLEIERSVFKKNFLLESCIINSYRIKDIEFEGDAKLYKIIFIKMFKNVEIEECASFTNTIFYKSAIFEKVVFSKFIQFKYTTFKEYTLFRDMKFEDGLDLDYTNIENGMRFYNLQGLDTKESIKNTSMETYRIIKYNFEQISNHIEANKFYMLEMNKYQDSIYCKNFWEEIVFAFNNTVSNFGQSWIRPLMIYLFIGFIFTLFMHNSSITNSFFSLLTNAYNPLDKCIIEKYNIIGLFYKVSSGLILYHLIISLKRQIKR